MNEETFRVVVIEPTSQGSYAILATNRKCHLLVAVEHDQKQDEVKSVIEAVEGSGSNNIANACASRCIADVVEPYDTRPLVEEGLRRERRRDVMDFVRNPVFAGEYSLENGRLRFFNQIGDSHVQVSILDQFRDSIISYCASRYLGVRDIQFDYAQ